ncbi:MAG: Mu-like prophage major head subunit gpT family protein [Gemmobacter sp.]|nr:Mu-like prophage major head subunit gpT family protein [Gemmobacter sp.]
MQQESGARPRAGLDKDGDGGEFLNDEYTCGIRARVNAWFGLWRFTYGSGQALAPRPGRAPAWRCGGCVTRESASWRGPEHSRGPAGLERSCAGTVGGGTDVRRNSAEPLISPHLQD